MRARDPKITRCLTVAAFPSDNSKLPNLTLVVVATPFITHLMLSSED